EQCQPEDDLGAVDREDLDDALSSGLRLGGGGVRSGRDAGIDLGEFLGLRAHLSVEEEGVDADRGDDDRDLLPGLIAAVRADERGHGEGEGGEDDDHRQIVRRAGAVVGHASVAQTADEQAQSDDRAEDDHRYGHDRIPGDRGMVAGAQQDRGDEDALDEADRDGQHEAAVEIAEAFGQMLGLGDDAEGADEDDRDSDDERGDEQGHGHRRVEKRPGELDGDEGAPAEDEADDRSWRDDAAEGGGHEG